MTGRRLALIVANDSYDDPGLKRLNSPAQDAVALSELLGDAGVGGFEVSVLRNESSQSVRTAVEDVFADRSTEDLVVLHFSCHGVKNADGELFLAMRDTKPSRLASTGVAAGFISGQMASSRAQRIALFLDCCYGGAFPRGMVVRSGTEAAVGDAFSQPDSPGEGRGRVVVTSSNAMQYAFEGGELADQEVSPSVFTSAVVDALTSGEADRDGDGWVGVGELFGYVSDSVHRIAPQQTPQMWTFGQQGDILLARSRVRRVRPAPLSEEVQQGMTSDLTPMRFGVADLLRERLGSADLGVALAAYQALESMRSDDSRKVSDLVEEALAGAVLHVEPPVVELAPGESRRVALNGPPLTRAVSARSGTTWLRVEYDDEGLTLTASEDEAPGDEAAVELVGPLGRLTLPVRLAPRLPEQRGIPAEPPAAIPAAAPPEPPAAIPAPAEPPAVPIPASLTSFPGPVPQPAGQDLPQRARRFDPALLACGALLLLGVLLYAANDPGPEGSRLLWSDPTGNSTYRESFDAFVVASLVVALAGLVGLVWARARPVAAGLSLGAACFLAVNAVSVLLEGQVPDDRGFMWPLTLVLACLAAACSVAAFPPRVGSVWTLRRVPVVLVGLAGASGLLALCLGPDSYNNYRGWTVVLMPIGYCALALLAVTRSGDRKTVHLLGASAVTFALLATMVAIPGVEALAKGNIDSQYTDVVLGHLLGELLAAVLLLIATLVASRRLPAHSSLGSSVRA